MASYIAYADYTIFFSDPDEFAFASGMVTSPGGILINPVDAGALFGVTYPPVACPIGTKVFIFVYS